MSKSHQSEMEGGIGGATCFEGKLYGPQRYADPLCYRGKAGGPPKFKVGDQVRVKDCLDMFYSQTPAYTRGVLGIVADIVYESPAPEDEAWGYTDKPEWFYLVRFRQQDLWPEDAGVNPNDKVEAEIPERWLEAAVKDER